MRSATSLEPAPPACTVPNEVFLSHSSRDRAFAERLVEVLRRHRIPVWYSKTDILGSQQWHDEIGRALERCDWFIVVLSPDALDSMWVRRELLYCLQENRFEGRIVPLLHRSCNYRKLSWTLPQIQKIDFTGGFEGGRRELLGIWGVGYAPPGRSS